MSVKIGPYQFSYTYIAYCLGCISYTFRDFVREIPKDFTEFKNSCVRYTPFEIGTEEELKLYFNNDECAYDEYLCMYDQLNFVKDMLDNYNNRLSDDKIIYIDSNIVITPQIMIREFVRKISECFGFTYITDNMIIKATPNSKYRKYLTTRRTIIGYVLQETLETHKDIIMKDCDGFYDSDNHYVNLFSDILTKK